MSTEADQRIGILIEFGLSDESAKQAVARLDEIKSAAGDSTEKFKLFNKEGMELRRVFAELTQISPVLGEAFRAMVNPIGGTLAASIFVFVEMKQHLDEINKALDKLGDEGAQGISHFADELESAREHADRLHKELDEHIEETTRKQRTLIDQTREMIEAFNEEADFTDRAINAAADAKIEQIRTLLTLGLLTRQEADVLEAKAREGAIDTLNKQKVEAAKQDVSINQGALDKAENAAPGLQSAMEKAFKNAEGGAGAIDRQARISEMENQHKIAMENQDKDRERVNKAETDFEGMERVKSQESLIADARAQIAKEQATLNDPNSTEGQKTAARQYISGLNQDIATANAAIKDLMATTAKGQELQAAQTQFAQDQNALSQGFMDQLSTLKQQQEDYEQQYNTAKQAWGQNQAAIQSFTQAIDTATAKLNALTSPTATAATNAEKNSVAAQALAGIAGEGGAAATFEKTAMTAQGIAGNIMGGKGATAGQADFLMQFVQDMGAHVQNVTQAAQWMKQYLGTDDQLLGVIQAILQRMQSRDAGIAAINGRLADLDARYAQLESQMGQNGSVN